MAKCFGINKKWPTLFAAMLVAAVMAGCSDNNNAQNKRGAKSKQDHNIIKKDGRVHFMLGDREFDVPAGNFKGGGETGGGQLVQVTLWGLLPNFEGYDKAKNHAKFVGPRQERGSDARIELYRRGDRITVPEMVSRRNKMKGNSPFSGRLGKYDELRYGLEYYRSDNRGGDIYLYIKDGEPEILIRCPTEIILKDTPFPSCNYYWDISEGASYEMRYSMDYLPQWREIWTNAKRLLNVVE